MFIGILLLNIIFGRFFGIISPTLTFYITFPLGTFMWAFWYVISSSLSPRFLVEKELAAALETALSALLIRMLYHYSVMK